MGCLTCSAWQSHNSNSVSLPHHQIIQCKKSNCPRQLCHCHMGCYQVMCCALSILPQVYFHVICVFSRFTKFENFDAKMLAFLRYVMSENHPSFDGKNNFVNSQIFRRVVKFGMCHLEFQISTTHPPPALRLNISRVIPLSLSTCLACYGTALPF